MNIWITTDTHFYHDKMLEYCGRPQGFEILIYKRLKAVLHEDDVLIHLGDIVVSSGQEEKAHAQFIQTLPGKHWLMRGNHDRKSNNWYLNHGWDCVAEYLADTYFGKRVVFSHIPLRDHGYDINFHGHFHNSDHRRHEPGLLAIKNDKQKLLALEWNNYQPWSLQTLIEHPQKYEPGKIQSEVSRIEV